MRNAYKILVRKPDRKRQLQNLKHIWEDNIRLNLRETGWEGVDWINLAQDRFHWQVLVNMEINLWAPGKLGNFLTC
jgi:hypothetical protein